MTIDRFIITLAALACGCAPLALAQQGEMDRTLQSYRERMTPMTPVAGPATTASPAHAGRTVMTQSEPRIQAAGGGPSSQRAALPVGGEAPSAAPDQGELMAELPDPRDAERVLRVRLDEVARDAREERIAKKYERVMLNTLDYLGRARRRGTVELGLQECIQRALEHNYSIRIDAYNPGISRTQLVEAEAAFDAAFFLDASWTNTDQPSASELGANQADQRQYRGGLRQLLPTGMQAEVSLGQSRTKTDLSFATINPAWDSTFNARLTQPLLKGFGLDVNRAQINIRRADADIALERFEQTVRDTLLDVERAYWALTSARQTMLIVAEAVAQNLETYKSMEQRQGHDATPVELENSRSRWKSREVEYLESIKNVRDAEDILKNLLNDPDLTLAQDVEIIPTSLPLSTPITIDQFAEVRVALDQRSEIREARLTIDKTRIQTNLAKNNTLPQLDVVFDYSVDGLARGADGSFDNLTTNKFRSYTVGVNFSYPLGDRAARAGLLRARMQETQAVRVLQQVTDGVVQEVNEAVRQIHVRSLQLPPQFDAVRAAVKNLRALQARAEAVNPAFLETELSAIERIVQARRVLSQVLSEYNLSIVELERAKGTLLTFNNVNIVDGLVRE